MQTRRDTLPAERVQILEGTPRWRWAVRYEFTEGLAHWRSVVSRLDRLPRASSEDDDERRAGNGPMVPSSAPWLLVRSAEGYRDYIAHATTSPTCGLQTSRARGNAATGSAGHMASAKDSAGSDSPPQGRSQNAEVRRSHRRPNHGRSRRFSHTPSSLQSSTQSSRFSPRSHSGTMQSLDRGQLARVAEAGVRRRLGKLRRERKHRRDDRSRSRSRSRDRDRGDRERCTGSHTAPLQPPISLPQPPQQQLQCTPVAHSQSLVPLSLPGDDIKDVPIYTV
jgi:hypothetical protein